MTPGTPLRPRMQHVATAGTALAVTLAPVVIGVLLAKTMAADPMTPINAMVTRGGQTVPLSPTQWRRCGHQALRRCVRRPGGHQRAALHLLFERGPKVSYHRGGVKVAGGSVADHAPGPAGLEGGHGAWR
ncbi:hypothetical protein AB0L71_24185 [Streptomyces sp. NPDC052052]|uniref:hypothetical protein n=1 Tax=Streptomyces sp. NPDC052052 TaxID=3154756 RepID=UPI003431AE40